MIKQEIEQSEPKEKFSVKIVHPDLEEYAIQHASLNILSKNNRTVFKFQTINYLPLLAGSKVYSDLWTRDAFHGILGIFATFKSKDFQYNKDYNGLDKETYIFDMYMYCKVLAKYQRKKDGLIPLRIGRPGYSYGTKLLFGFYVGGDYRPIYVDDKRYKHPTDSNPQFIIVCWLYYNLTGNADFLFEIKNEIRKAYLFMITTRNKENGLLQGKYFNSWYDTFCFDGPDLYSNVLFIYSIKCFERLNNILEVISPEGLLDYDLHLKSFKEHFWTYTSDIAELNPKTNGKPQQLIGYLKIHKDINSMETVGNSLAIIFNLLNDHEEQCILKSFKNNLIKSELPILPVTYPKLANKYLWTRLFLVNMQGYHNDRLWEWNHMMYCVALKKCGENYKEALKPVTLSFRKHKTFFENVQVDEDGILGPHSTHMIQNSEENFTYALGTYLLCTLYHEDLF